MRMKTPLSIGLVAIPSNRVNVSYAESKGLHGWQCVLSQSPQIGSMFLTEFWEEIGYRFPKNLRRNPLKSGQCFLRVGTVGVGIRGVCGILSQSPQIGSMFLTKFKGTIYD